MDSDMVWIQVLLTQDLEIWEFNSDLMDWTAAALLKSFVNLIFIMKPRYVHCETGLYYL